MPIGGLPDDLEAGSWDFGPLGGPALITVATDKGLRIGEQDGPGPMDGLIIIGAPGGLTRGNAFPGSRVIEGAATFFTGEPAACCFLAIASLILAMIACFSGLGIGFGAVCTTGLGAGVGVAFTGTFTT